MNTDVRILTDEQLEVIGELALDFPSQDVKLIERVNNDSDSDEYDTYGYTVSYMIAVATELFTLHLSQWQGVSVMSIDDEGNMDFQPTGNQFSIIDYIRNINKNILN